MKKNAWIIWVVVLLLALSLLAYIVMSQEKKQDGEEQPAGNGTVQNGATTGEAPPEEQTDGSTSSMLAGPNAIAAFDQPAANSAVVTLVTMEDDGFVVLHASNKGQAGAVVGTSRLLRAGAYDNLRINYDVAQSNGAEIIAMLHADNGDGEFNASEDSAVMMNGAAVQTTFMLDADAEIPADIAL